MGHGPVRAAEVLPNGDSTVVPTAAATCIGPVSLVMNILQAFTSAHSSLSEVRPAKLVIK
jgi:hypothetical protein